MAKTTIDDTCRCRAHDCVKVRRLLAKLERRILEVGNPNSLIGTHLTRADMNRVQAEMRESAAARG